MNFLKRGAPPLAIALSFGLLAGPDLRFARGQDAPREITIVVVEGEGAIRRVRERAVSGPVIRVEDQDRRPVAGVAVVFALPADGPSGEFANGAQVLTMATDEKGVAAVVGMKSNQLAGQVPIRVSASYRGLTARMTITQFNMQVPGRTARAGGGKIAVILAVVGAAAAGGVIAATRRSGGRATPSPSTPATPVTQPIGITPGAGVITTPH